MTTLTTHATSQPTSGPHPPSPWKRVVTLGALVGLVAFAIVLFPRNDEATRPNAMGGVSAMGVVDESSFFTIRPVFGKLPPPCSSPSAPPSGSHVFSGPKDMVVVGCFQVGAAVIDANDVTAATARANTVLADWDVEVSLRDEASARMDALVARWGFGSQMAIVVNATVVGAPRMDFTHFSGKAIVSGFGQVLTAQALADRLHHA